MKTLTCLAALVLLLLGSPGLYAAAKPQKSTDFEGAVTAIDETSVTVKSGTATKKFAIYAGTVFGQRAKGKLSDFKVGDTVHVTFSEVGGQAKAENVRNPADDRKKPAKKKK